MTAMMKTIKDMKKLEKRIVMWDAIAALAERISQHARTKYCEYTYRQEELIRDLNIGTQDYMDEVRKENNRRNFKVESDL